MKQRLREGYVISYVITSLHLRYFRGVSKFTEQLRFGCASMLSYPPSTGPHRVVFWLGVACGVVSACVGRVFGR